MIPLVWTIVCVGFSILIVICEGFLLSRFITHFMFPLINISGNSMEPTYTDGELIWSTSIFSTLSLKPGDVIVYRVPHDEERKVIKRITEVCGRYVFCMGDNRDGSYDSRHYGYVPFKNILSKVIKPRPRIM